MVRMCCRALLCLSLPMVQIGCSANSDGSLSCLNARNCPPGCSCHSLDSVCVRDDNRCGGTCDNTTICPEGESCKFDGDEQFVRMYACLPDGTGGTGGTGGAGGTGGTPRCTSLSGELVWSLDWTNPDVNLDLGGVTPNTPPGNIISANLNDETKDPNCEHGGDAPLESGGVPRETATCTSVMTGDYSIAVDNNFGSVDEMFTVNVTIGGNPVPPFPQTANATAGATQEFDFCVQ